MPSLNSSIESMDGKRDNLLLEIQNTCQSLATFHGDSPLRAILPRNIEIAPRSRRPRTARGFKKVKRSTATLVPILPSFQKLLMVRRCVRERIIEATAIPFRGAHKSVEIFLDIDRLEEQAFATNCFGVSDQNSCVA